MPSRNTIQIEIQADDNASSKLSQIGRSISGLTGPATSASRGISGLGAAIAGGFGAAVGTAVIGTIGNIANGLRSLGAEALAAVASHERLGMALESLVAKELVRASGVEKVVKVGQARLELTKAEQAEIGKLSEKIQDETLSRNTLAARMQEEQERIRQLTAQYGENGLVVQTHRAKLAEMRNEYEKSGGEIANYQARIDALQGKEGRLVDVTKKVIEGQLSMADALAQAGPKAQELVGWIQKLAIQSPFTEADVAASFRMAMAYGFTTDEAKRLTQATIDFAAGSGATGESMNRIALALGQIQAKGKLSGQEVLQLTEAGINVRDALLQAGNVAGLTAENFASMQERGLIPANKAIEAIVSTLEKDFGGAAKRQSGTFSGLLSSLSDIKTVGLREFFTGTFKAIQPYLDKFVASFTEGGLLEKIGAVGESVGAWVATSLIPALQTLWQFTTTTLVPAFTEVYNWLATNIPAAIQTVSEFWTGTLQPALNSVWQFVQTYILPVFDMVSSWFQTEGPGSVGGFADTVSGVLGPVLEFARQMFANVVNWVQENWPLIQQTVQTVLQAISDFWADHGQSIIAAVTEAWGFVKTIIETAINAILGIVQVVMLAINGDWSAAWEALKAVLFEVWEGIKAIVQLGFNASQRIFEVAKSTLSAAWDGIWRTIKSAASQAWADVVSGVSGWIDSIKAKFKEAVDKLKAIGADIVAGIKAGIEDAWGAFIDWILGKMGTIIQAIADFLGIESPSKVMAVMGRQLMAGLAQGIGDGVSVPVRAMLAAGTGVGMAAAGGLSTGAAPMPGRMTVTGDTYYVTVTDRLAAAVMLSNIRDRQQRRLAVGMGY